MTEEVKQIELNERSRSRYHNNPEQRAKKLAGQKKRRENPATRKLVLATLQVNRANQWARKFESAEGKLTRKDWLELCDRYGNKCLACGESSNLTIDHVVPFTKGGSNLISNIQPLCMGCNRKKKNKTIDYRKGK